MRNKRDRDYRDHRDRSSRHEDSRQHSDYQRDRSRNKNNRGYHNRGNNFYRQNSQRSNNNMILRNVHSVIIDQPKQFIISDNPELENTPARFQTKIQKSENVPEPLPVQKNSRVHELKDKITPVQKIWTSHIKQYLNDSEFVEIYRPRKSLAYGPIQYGKTMIKYDEGDKSMFYENQSSQSKIFSRAYFKIWEILAMGVFDKKNESLTMASVAEGPGGFIHALIDFRKKNFPEITDQYYSITLKIDNNTRNAKDWNDFRGNTYFTSMRNLGYKIKLSYGATDTGDLLIKENIDYFAQEDLQNKKCYLVTGDGGIECKGDKQFDYQEVFNVKLFLGEIITALKVQQLGGKFILKVYDCCFSLTRQLMTLLATFYKKVRMIKPVTSRPGNSEKYMLCEDFIGLSNDEYQTLKDLLTEWAQVQPDVSYFQNKGYVTNILEFPGLKNTDQIQKNLEEANQYFLEQQAQKLEEGLQLIQDNDGDAQKIQKLLHKKRYEEQMSYAHEWCRRYGLKSIDVALKEKQDIPENQQKQKQQQ